MITGSFARYTYSQDVLLYDEWNFQHEERFTENGRRNWNPILEWSSSSWRPPALASLIGRFSKIWQRSDASFRMRLDVLVCILGLKSYSFVCVDYRERKCAFKYIFYIRICSFPCSQLLTARSRAKFAQRTYHPSWIGYGESPRRLCTVLDATSFKQVSFRPWHNRFISMLLLVLTVNKHPGIRIKEIDILQKYLWVLVGQVPMGFKQ